MPEPSPVRVVILTALDIEYEAVLAHLADLTVEAHPAGTLFEIGWLRDPERRVAVGLTGAGNTNAAVVAERAIGMFAPQALFFVGIAGALHDDLALADVVFATKVYGYHGGRADDEGFRAAPETWYPPHDLEQVAHRIVRKDVWHKRLGGTAASRVHFRPIAAGEVVLNSTAHPLRTQLERNYTDAAAIEMESAGVARAGQLNRSLPSLTIRGISDRADGKKYADDTADHRKRAMIAAAAFAAELAGHVSAPPAPGSPTAKVQNVTGYGGLVVGVMDGDAYVHPDMPDV